jgi:hypothetical protein
LASFGKLPILPLASFGTDGPSHWLRLVNCPSCHWLRLVLRTGSHWLRSRSCPSYHWVPLKIGADTTAIMQARLRPGPAPFSWGGASIPMVMTVRLARRVAGCASSHLTIGFVAHVPQLLVRLHSPFPRAGCRSGVASLHSRGCRPTHRPPSGTGPEQRPTSWGHEPGSFGTALLGPSRRPILPLGSFGVGSRRMRDPIKLSKNRKRDALLYYRSRRG